MSLSSLVLVGLIATNAAPWGPGGSSRPEDLTLSVVTFGPGTDLPSWWGHTALVVDDRRLHAQRLYNYGMFGFDTGFVHKFVQGRLEFWVDAASVGGTFALYRELDRDVRLQILDLKPEQVAKAALALEVNILPENRVYLYQHYNDNCSTRPRDIVDQAVDGALKRATSVPSRMSLREHTRRYTQVFPPMSLVLDYLQNNELDRPITQQEEAFLPDELERQLDALKIDGRPLVKEKRIVYAAKERPVIPEQPPNWNAVLFLLSVLSGGAVWWLSRRREKWARVLLGSALSLHGLVLGALGIFLFIVGIWTNHSVAHHNENLFLINPFTFGFAIAGPLLVLGRPSARPLLKKLTATLAVIATLGVAVKVLPMFNQQNWNLICYCLPFILISALAFSRTPAAK